MTRPTLASPPSGTTTVQDGPKETHLRGIPRLLGLYIHIPFCAHKCPYCDFNTYAGLEAWMAPYVEALIRELDHWRQVLDRPPVDTVFVGGGTPTLLPSQLLARILEAVDQAVRLQDGCEITVEANPGTVDRTRFADLRALGVNRLSMGAQSFQPHELRFLGRIHDAGDVVAAFRAARAAGFDNINLDFIFGLPHQRPADWSDTLAQALALAPEHLSLYSLIVEPNTPLFHWVQTGKVTPPDDDLAARLYETAMEHLDRAGYIQYEISNWARATSQDRQCPAQTPAYACRHNLHYWRNETYLGVGAGAYGYLDRPVHPLTWTASDLCGVRWGNHRPVPGYICRVRDQGHAVVEQDPITPTTAMAETMMLGLRLVQEGVSLARFARRHGRPLMQVYAAQVERLTTQGLLEWVDDHLRLTRRGVLVGNQVALAFLPD